MIYKIYGNSKIQGYTRIATRTNIEDALSITDKLSAKEYYSYMIVENDGKGDNIVKQESLYEECKVEYVDNLKSKIEVKATIVKPDELIKEKYNRAKNKKELRELTEKYVER